MVKKRKKKFPFRIDNILTMKALQILIALLICCTVGYAQIRPHPGQQTTDKQEAKRIEQQVKTFFLQFRDKESGTVVEIERTVMEAQFQEMIDEIDLLYHTPPAMRDSIRTKMGHSAGVSPGKLTKTALR